MPFHLSCAGVYIRSERLSNKENQDVFFLITAQNCGTSHVKSGKNNDPAQHSESEVSVPKPRMKYFSQPVIAPYSP